MSTLTIKDLHASVETAEGPKEILKGVNLTINSGEIHAIMGPMALVSPPWLMLSRGTPPTRSPAVKPTSMTPRFLT